MLLCGAANISQKHPRCRFGLNYKFVGTGVTPWLFVERTHDPDVRFWHIASLAAAHCHVRYWVDNGLRADIA